MTLIAGVLATVLLVQLAAATPKTVEDTPLPGTTITGTVATPDGGPLPDSVFVWLREPDPIHDLDYDLEARGRSNVITPTGEFSFANVAPGRYVLRAIPRDVPPFNYAPSRPVFVDVFTSPVSLIITLTKPSVTGTLYAPGGLSPAEGIVHVYTTTWLGPIEVERRRVWPENDGVFVVGGLPTGTFKFQAEPIADALYWWSDPQSVLVQPASPQYISLTLTSPQVRGIVRYASGAQLPPVPDALVRAMAANGTHRSDTTGPQGVFAIGSLPTGVVTLTVVPPPELAWLVPPDEPITAEIAPGPAAFVPITLTAPDKTVYGWVRTNEVISQPVQHALVQAFRVGAPGYKQDYTDLNGYYTMTLAPGLWAVKISPVSTTLPNHWVYPFEARLVAFQYNRAPEHKPLNFRVWIADATVIGAVELPPHGSGNPPNFTVTVSLNNDEGIGLAQLIDANGYYTFNVPHGLYKLSLRVASSLYAAPPPQTVMARPISPTYVPTITLWPRNALITGTLTEQGTGNPIADVPVIAWNPDTHATFGTHSGENGVYALAVYSGTWWVRPAPLPSQAYVYTGGAVSVNAHAYQIARQDFELTPANATIHGILVDENNAPVTEVRGWASAQSNSGIRNGAPVKEGEFDILVPAGTYTVALHLPSGQMYLWDNQAQVATVSSNTPANVTMTLVTANAKLVGAVWNARTNESVGRDVDGRVWAWDSGLWTGTDIKPGNFYTLPVPAGEWRLNYAIDPNSGFVKTAGPRTYAVPAGTVQYAPLPVAFKDGTLTGTVWLTPGVPARGAVVVAEALSPDIQQVTLRAPVDYDGRFTMTLPSGLYNVRSVLAHNDWRMINPRLTAVNVPRNGSASVTLMYRWADAAITGTVSLLNPPPTAPGPVWVYGWTLDDGYNFTVAPVNGVYTLPVLAGQTWKVTAVYEWPNQYWITRTLVTVPTGTAPVLVNQDLVLAGPKLKPAPVTVMFDALQDQYIELADGTRIYIPAGAMPTTGRVLLHITPIANALRQRNGDVLGLSYVFEAFTEDGQPITDNFNQDVVIVLKYDPLDLLQQGIDPRYVRPAYFSTTTNSWTMPDSFVVDPDRHEITMQIDHFTRFGSMSIQPSSQVFLPIVIR